jgi:hypothetical protein
MAFKLQFSRTVQKALDKLPCNAVRKIFPHLEELKRDPCRPLVFPEMVCPEPETSGRTQERSLPTAAIGRYCAGCRK